MGACYRCKKEDKFYIRLIKRTQTHPTVDNYVYYICNDCHESFIDWFGGNPGTHLGSIV